MRCPSCATAVPQGGSFCGHCGKGLAQASTHTSALRCPGCTSGGPGTTMETFGLAPSAAHPTGTTVNGCRTCGGVWVDKQALDTLLAAASAESIPDGTGAHAPSVRQRRMATTKVVYRRCAACNEHMARRNFARVSGVIVDQCRDHGSFFDAGELEDVLAFVRSGGLRLAAKREAEEQAREARHRAQPSNVRTAYMEGAGDASGIGFVDDVDTLGSFVRWATGWVTGR